MTFLLSLGLITNLGCLGQDRQKQELLEAELRSQERHIQEMKAELDRKEGLIHNLDVEVERCQRAALAGKPPGGDSAPVVNVVRDITLGRLTGGTRQNPKASFDDALLVVFIPRDADGHALKAPGSVHIDLFEITPQGLKTPLSSWDVTARELRRLWDEPLIGGASYRITLPWKALPTTERLRVVARFTTLDGKLFEAERDITISLPPGVMRPGMPIGVPGYCPPPMTQAAPEARAEERPAPAKPDEPLVPPVATTPKPTKPKEPPAGIPVIELPPREFPADTTAKPDPNRVPPPLPAPPAIPTLDGVRNKNDTREVLPEPRTSPATDNPIPAGTSAIPTKRSSTATPLTAPPPASWRGQHLGLVHITHSDTPVIKLSRPLPASAVSDR
jgi:hypothetical protein